jgi:hypothetical protein
MSKKVKWEIFTETQMKVNPEGAQRRRSNLCFKMFFLSAGQSESFDLQLSIDNNINEKRSTTMTWMASIVSEL